MLSYVREIIRQFLPMQGIQRFLQRALSTPFLAMIQDPRLFGAAAKPGDNETLVHYSAFFAEGLVTAFASISSLARYFFQRAAEIGGLEFLQTIFYDLLLKPALMNPKLFGLLPETGKCPQSRVFVELTRIVWWVIKPDQLNEPRYEQHRKLKDLPEFQGYQFGHFFERLTKYDGEIEGISLSKLQDVTGVRYHLLLMSVNDVVFLTEIINSTLDKLTDEEPIDALKALVNFQIPVENNEVVDFWFQEFRSPIVPAGIRFAGEPVSKPEIVLPLLQGVATVEARTLATVVGHFTKLPPGPQARPERASRPPRLSRAPAGDGRARTRRSGSRARNRLRSRSGS
jgi:hypothetical protein